MGKDILMMISKKEYEKIGTKNPESLAAVERGYYYSRYNLKKFKKVILKWKNKSEIKIRGEPPG